MNGVREVGGGEAESVAGVVGDREGLVEAGGKGLKEEGLECGGDGGVENGEGDGAFAIDKGLE